MKPLTHSDLFRKAYKTSHSLIILVLFASQCFAQTKNLPGPSLTNIQNRYGLDPKSSFLSRVDSTPGDIISDFREAGMSPTEHPLTGEEQKIVSEAFNALPPLHRQVLKQHLKSISFLDNMPNTALTSPVTKDEDAFKLYHITFRAGILHQTISDWVTEKERGCFVKGDSAATVSIQAGILSALTYVMLHEGTHVVDGSLGIIAADTVAGITKQNAFTKEFAQGLWKDINRHAWLFPDSILTKSRFRPGGRPFPAADATRVYAALSQTPFVSLYGMASWHEDLAELFTIYHLTHTLKQPFRLVVKQYGKEIFSYEPMKAPLVKKRSRLLRRFYATQRPLHPR